jgi:hypothetical protein
VPKKSLCSLRRVQRKNMIVSDKYGEEAANQEPKGPNDRSRLAYMMFGLMGLVIIERLFIKGDILLNTITSTLGIVVGYYFGQS